MASKVSHLPHIKNVAAGMNRWDPMYKAIFEVQFTIPPTLQSDFQQDEVYLSQQVTKVSGLDVLQKTVQPGSQKFLGVDVSYLQPVLDSTFAEITIEMNLNIRNVTDAYVLKVFKAWEKLGYDLATGYRTLKADYVADHLHVAEANRDGTIWRTVEFHDLLLVEVTGLDDLDYTATDARLLTVKFRSDYWDEDMEEGQATNG